MNKRSSIISLFFLTIAPFSGDRVEAMDMGPDPSMPFLASMDDACIPNFTHEQWVVAPQHIVNSVHDGNWSTAANWDGPLDANAVVRVNNQITFDADATVYAIGIYPNASLTFLTDKTMTLKLVDLLVDTDGLLQIGTASKPIDSSVTVTIMFRDVPINETDPTQSELDPGQYGNGMISFGAVHIHGASMNQTFVRLASEPKAGDTTLSLSQAVTGWNIGDILIVPDSRLLDWNEHGGNFVPQWEQVTLSGVSANGKTLTLNSGLKFSHLGGYNANNVLQYLPHVADLTRNVRFTSENPDTGVRGHTMSSGWADVDVEYASFVGMGRTTTSPRDNTTFDSNCNATHVGTNQIARYGLHVHHLAGSSGLPAATPQYQLIGNAIDGGDSAMAQNRRWGLTIHGSHYGEISQNVVYRIMGAGIVAEDGSETANRIENNFVMRIGGTGSKEDGNNIDDFGDSGHGYWFRGPNNYVLNNVATNTEQGSPYSYGFNLAMNWLGNITIPAYKGAMPEMAGQGTVVDGNGIPLLQFSDNEVYGAVASGISIWGLGVVYRTIHGNAGTIKNFRLWHHYGYACFGYESNNLVIDGMTVLGDTSGRMTGEWPLGLFFADYMQQHLQVINADVEGMENGIYSPAVSNGAVLYQNCYLQNIINFLIEPMGSVNGSAQLPPRSQIIRDCLFVPVARKTETDILMDYRGGIAGNIIQQDQTYVYNYNRVQGANFQTFYTQQDPSFVVPTTGDSGGPSVGAPPGDEGLTNTQLIAKYPTGATILGYFFNPIVVAGEIATCADITTHPLISGYTCPISANAPPTIMTGAAASPNPVTGTTTNLSVLGADDGGESNLTYTWTVVGTPPSPVVFSANSSNAAKSTEATFLQTGTYNLQVTIQDAAGQSATSQVTVTVNQALTTLSLSPTNDSVGINRTKQFTATALDQFNQPLTAQPSFTWSVAGGGSINSSGLFTAGSSVGGPFTVTATGGGQTATAQITITLSQPPNISVTSPSNRATFTTPATITIRGSASDDDGSVSMVEFFANGKSIGMIMSSFAPFSFTWSVLTAGNYTLTAVATDNQNTQTTSPPLFITVTAAPTGGTGPVNEGGKSGQALSDFVVDVRAGTVTPPFPQGTRLNFYTRQGKEILSTQNPTPDMFRNFAMGIYVCRPDGTGPASKMRKVLVKK